ncbi:MAG: hypothetical protein J7K04_05425 [Spirochaetales bacterium]|nr:hypothetical protein [Spirochaetales bacterium]
MIKNPAAIKKLEDEFIKKEGKIPFEKSLEIYEAMWREAVSLGIFPPKNPLEGIEKDIKLAKILNSCSKSL